MPALDVRICPLSIVVQGDPPGDYFARLFSFQPPVLSLMGRVQYWLQ